MADIDHMLHTATSAADVLKAQLIEIAGNDPDALHDTIEGEIDLVGLISMAAEENLKDDALVDGTTTLINELVARRDRIKKRIGMRRVAILAAMQAGEIKKLETPAGTLSRKAVPPSALVLEEAKIPAEFWRAVDPALDKRAVLEALKAGHEVPGAMLSNGGETLAVRT